MVEPLPYNTYRHEPTTSGKGDSRNTAEQTPLYYGKQLLEVGCYLIQKHESWTDDGGTVNACTHKRRTNSRTRPCGADLQGKTKEGAAVCLASANEDKGQKETRNRLA